MEGTVPEKTEQNKTSASKASILRNAETYLAKVREGVFLEAQIIMLWSYHKNPIILPLKYLYFYNYRQTWRFMRENECKILEYYVTKNE